MGVLGSSREIEAAIYAYAARRDEAAQSICMGAFEPFVMTLARKHPLWVQEDLQQELRLYLHIKLLDLVALHQAGKVRKLLAYTLCVLDRHAKTYVAKQLTDSGRYVRIDDIELETYTGPDPSPERKDLSAHLKKAGAELAKARFDDRANASRASRWATVLTKGQRPKMTSNCVARFNGTRYREAKHMYSIMLQNLRELLLEAEGRLDVG